MTTIRRMPWGMFYWSDYAGDEKLKLCSFAAQGLWMRMLCLAAAHEPVGYVAVNGQALDSKRIARATGGALEEVETLIAELEQNAVFSRDRRGWIYSRRMINDAKRRRTATDNGKKGGNPSLRKQTRKLAEDKGEVIHSDKGGDKLQSPESIDHIDSVSDDTAADRGASNDPEGAAFDPVKALFDDGIAVLGNVGVKQPRARSLIGQWRKAHGDEAVALALAAAESQHISQPLEWIPKWLASRTKSNPEASIGDGFMDAMAADYLGPKKGD